jgi:hypothetical protein
MIIPVSLNDWLYLRGENMGKAKIENEYIVFSTGTKISANNGIIGINFDDEEKEFCTYDGYDGTIQQEWMTREEKIELADLAIEMWSQYRAQI